ncbi:MAG TPA: protein-glutamate O-methyltransferase CheR, partial [Gemmatimonadales bacterium]|nr:protein-glutamate O-methyltransferase CheR [Gemmatimonadales bacterium]
MLSAGIGIRPLTDREFKLFQSLIHKEAGIYLSEVKKALLVGRLSRRIRELGLDSFEAYYRHVVEGQNPTERVELINNICTHETQFFREPRQFEFLEQTLAPQWRAEAEAGTRPKQIRAWSAACSSGEEPVSMAMSLLYHFPASAGWSVEVLATDISTRVLDKARAATWPIERAGQIPPAYLKRFMLRGTGEQQTKMRAGPEIRSVVRFQQLNLQADSYAVGDGFDLIFCRNVLIYFNAASKEHVVSRLLGRLGESGLLFLGHAESLTGMRDQPRAVIPT